MIEAGAFGKKVFFLYPPPVLVEVVEDLARSEFEVYLAHDHDRLRRALASDPAAIVFINLDAGLDEAGWEGYVRGLRGNAATAGIGIGLVSLNEPDASLREKYLMEIQIPCGFVVLKIGQAKSKEILMKTLEANEARGRRKFVRAACAPGIGSCVVDHGEESLRAELDDLSSAGAAVRFEKDPRLRVGTVLRGLVLTVKGVRISADAFVAATRSNGDGATTHVLMFVPSHNDDSRLERLRTLVFRINQASMDKLLSTA